MAVSYHGSPFEENVDIRHGVKYIEMYLNTNKNTLDGFK